MCGGAAPNQYRVMPISNGIWTHIAVSYSKTDELIRIYKDGNFVQDFVYLASDVSVTYAASWGLVIGADSVSDPSTANYNHFNGMIDDIFLYNRTLSDSEVLNIFNCEECPPKYYGQNCSTTICNNIFSNDSTVCQNHGNCTFAEICFCEKGYFGQYCNTSNLTFVCYGLFSNDSSVCSGHGDCVDDSICNCDSDYFGEFCNVTFCHDRYSNESNTCSNHGNCISKNKCVCLEGYGPGYISNGSLIDIHHGTNLPPLLPPFTCSLYLCGRYLSNDSEACSAHGNCIGPNNCTCEEGWFHGYSEELGIIGFSCDSFLCGERLNYEDDACGNLGTCESKDYCSCPNSEQYYVNDWICEPMESNDEEILVDTELCYWIFLWNPRCNAQFIAFMSAIFYFCVFFICFCVCLVTSPIWCVVPSLVHKSVMVESRFLVMKLFGKIKKEKYLLYSERPFWEQQYHPLNICVFISYVFQRNCVFLVNFFGDVMCMVLGICTLVGGSVGLEYINLLVQIVIVISNALGRLEQACFVTEPWKCYEKCCTIFCSFPRGIIRFAIVGITSFLLLLTTESIVVSYILKGIRLFFTIGMITNQCCQISDLCLRISFFRLEKGFYDILFAGAMLKEMEEIAQDVKEELPVLLEPLHTREDEKTMIPTIVVPVQPSYMLPKPEYDIITPEVREKVEVYTDKRKEYILRAENFNQFEGRLWRDYDILNDVYKSLTARKSETEKTMGDEVNKTVREVKKEISFGFLDKVGEFCTCWCLGNVITFVILPFVCVMSVSFLPLIYGAKQTIPVEVYVSLIPCFLSLCGTALFAWFGVLCICAGFDKYYFKCLAAMPLCMCVCIVALVVQIFGIIEVPSSLAKKEFLSAQFGVSFVVFLCLFCVCCPFCLCVTICICPEVVTNFFSGIWKMVSKKSETKEKRKIFPQGGIFKLLNELNQIKRVELKKKKEDKLEDTCDNERKRDVEMDILDALGDSSDEEELPPGYTPVDVYVYKN